MKLKELIEKSDLKKVAELLYWRFEKNEKDEPEKEKILGGVERFVEKLAEPTESETHDLVIKIGQEMFGEVYVDVSMRNNDFVCDPPEDLKPWGGDGDKRDDCPEGSFNVNWKGYYRVYGIGGDIKNNQFYDGELIFENCALENFFGAEGILFEIIWELSFYGWDDEERIQFFKGLNEQMDDAKPEDYISLEEIK